MSDERPPDRPHLRLMHPDQPDREAVSITTGEFRLHGPDDLCRDRRAIVGLWCAAVGTARRRMGRVTAPKRDSPHQRHGSATVALPGAFISGAGYVVLENTDGGHPRMSSRA